ESQKQKPRTSAQAGGSIDAFTGPFEIRSDSLFYKQETHRGVYQGSVRMQSPSATMTSDELEIFFRPPAAETNVVPGAANSEIERALATGNVVITQPTRKSSGNQAEYIPGENKIILSGNLAKVVDAQRGTTEGARLTYYTAGDRIFVQ